MDQNKEQDITYNQNYSTPQSALYIVNSVAADTLDPLIFLNLFNMAINKLNAKCQYNAPQLTSTDDLAKLYPLADFLWKSFVTDFVLARYYESENLYELAQTYETNADATLVEIKSSSVIPQQYIAAPAVGYAHVPYIKKKVDSNTHIIPIGPDGYIRIPYKNKEIMPWLQDGIDVDGEFLRKEFWKK